MSEHGGGTREEDIGEVEGLAQRIDAERGRRAVLVNDIWGGELLFEWNTPVWEHALEKGPMGLRERQQSTKEGSAS